MSKTVPVMSMALNRDHLIELLYQYIAEQQKTEEALEAVNDLLSRDVKIAVKTLESISRNSCCETCQEAKLVAREALKKLGVD